MSFCKPPLTTVTRFFTLPSTTSGSLAVVVGCEYGAHAASVMATFMAFPLVPSEVSASAAMKSATDDLTASPTSSTLLPFTSSFTAASLKSPRACE